MKKNLFLIVCMLLVSNMLTAQKTPAKLYPKLYLNDYMLLNSNWGELDKDGRANKVFEVTATKDVSFYFNSLSNMVAFDYMDVFCDDVLWGTLKPQVNGWQYVGGNLPKKLMLAGKHYIRIRGNNMHVPMVEEIFTGLTPYAFRVNPVTDAFLGRVERSRQQAAARGAVLAEDNDMNKVLPNPEGNYAHAIDTSFSYSHFSTIYLNTGYHTFTTAGSSTMPSLTIFLLSNPATATFANANGAPGGEASLPLYVSTAGYYAIMIRPVNNGASGTTNIIYNGSTLVPGAIIGGRHYNSGGLKGGSRNFFTCRLTGSSDTRITVSRYLVSSVRAYNDDYYSGTGSWNWGLSSRIRNDFGADSVQFAFVCAYSPGSEGIGDIYLANENSPVYNTNYPEFPLLKADDAIMAANNNNGYYNCISWSGGITGTWVWPPSWSSTYSCSGSYGDITCFDHFYANTPVRYPGAWNYTRSGATSTNATVDVWKLGTNYTHGSVRKPGNNHPHGYDWESKPGGLTRTFHPRNALTNLSYGYGAVTDYYRHTGTFARYTGGIKAIESDADAVKAGLAVFENATLSFAAQQKLRSFMMKTNRTIENRFNELYNQWDATKAANALYSDPLAYCKNPEFEAMLGYAQKHPREAMILTFDKYVNGNDHIVGELLWMLTRVQYGKLIDEVKRERTENPNDEMGRYKIHGDHDNGVLYVEKILKGLNDIADVTPAAALVTVTASPNPAKDWFTVKLNVTANSLVSVKAVSAQTRAVKVLQAEKQLAPGNYAFTLNATGFAGGTGDIITLQVTVNGEVNTYKVMIAK